MKIRDVLLISKLFEVILEKNVDDTMKIENKSFEEESKKFFVDKSDIEKYILSNTNFKKTTKKLFYIMNENDFSDNSSVNSTFDIHIKNMLGSYDFVKQIDLYSHTLHVMFETINIAKESEIPKDRLSILLLIAQLHDFGKCREIEKIYKQENNRNHADTSAEFAEHFFDKKENKKFTRELSKEQIKTVLEAVKKHHYSSEDNTWILNVQSADRQAREKETLLVKRKLRANY